MAKPKKGCQSSFHVLLGLRWETHSQRLSPGMLQWVSRLGNRYNQEGLIKYWKITYSTTKACDASRRSPQRLKVLLTKLSAKGHVLATGGMWFSVQPPKNQTLFIYEEIETTQFWRKSSSSRRDVGCSCFSSTIKEHSRALGVRQGTCASLLPWLWALPLSLSAT